MSEDSFDITVVIPTYDRNKILIETINHLLNQIYVVADILVVDQTLQHNLSTENQLKEWSEKGCIRWLRIEKPSITHAMNTGLKEAKNPIVLFLDDDIIPGEGLFSAHTDNYKDIEIWAVVGQVLQPGESPYNGSVQCRTTGARAYLDFPFNSSSRAWVNSAMAGNLSVRKERAFEIGGFDENFVGVAYRFETEFLKSLETEIEIVSSSNWYRGWRYRYA